MTSQALLPGAGFPGLNLQDEYSAADNSADTPPDAESAVGPNHIAQLINRRFAVYTKTGTFVTAESLDQFWAGVQPSGIAVDPRILYDGHSGRWFAASRDTSNLRTLNDLLFAVSATNDPTGNWTLYKVVAGTGCGNVDYDTLGMDDNGVYFGMKFFDLTTGKDSSVIFATPKSPLLTGGPVSVTKFYGISDMAPVPQPAYNFDAVQPSDPAWIFGSTLSLSGVAYRTITWNGSTPTLSATTVVPTPSYGPLVKALSLGATMPLNTNDQRLLMAVVRNHQLWTARTVGVNSGGVGTSTPDRDAAEFLEFDVSSAHASLIQSGRAFDSSPTNPRSYYFPSLAVNGLGYMMMGFSGSTATEFIGAYMTARLPSDPAGALQPITLIKAGQGPYTLTMGGLTNRWGDYSTTVVDPTDDRTIWTDQEFAGATVPAGSPAGEATSRWATWIQSFSSPQLATAAIIFSSPNPSALGSTVTFAAVVASPGSAATPTGTVDFAENGVDLTPGGVPLSAGSAAFTTSMLAQGTHTITASYSGDGDFLPSSGDDSAAPQLVRALSATSITSTPNPAVVGQMVTLTVVVTAGAGIPTGSVTFVDGATNLTPNGISLVNGMATATASFPSAGNHTVTATYSGDANLQGSSGDNSALPLLVNQAASQTLVSPSPAPSVFGQLVTLTASVTAVAPGAGLPTGRVDFADGPVDLTPGGVSLSAGVATFATRGLARGTHTIQVSYAGDANFNASQGDDSAAAHLVNQSPSRTSIKNPISQSLFGQVVTMTAVVQAAAPGSGNPTGSVAFLDGNATLGIGAIDTSHQATFSIATLARATHAIQAVYGGDGNFLASPSGQFGLTVIRAASQSAISSSNPSSVFGELVTLTATITPVAPGAGEPTGTVTFQEGSATLAAHMAVNAGCQAIFVTKALAVGTHTITALYSGDVNFAPGSTAAAQVVTRDGTQTEIKSSANASVFGQAVTLTATVHPSVPGSGVPLGLVTFLDSGHLLATSALTGGVATASAGLLAIGNHTLTASYGGDGSFVASTSGTFAQSVTKAFTLTTLLTSPNPTSYGKSVTLTAIVQMEAPGFGAPIGTLYFRDGSKTLATLPVEGAGQVTFGIAALSAGLHTISAIYSGDAHFVGSSSNSLTETIAPAVTTTAVSVSPMPTVLGQSVTIKATIASAVSGVGAAGGTVQLKDGTKVLATLSIDSGGRATFHTSTLGVGKHTLTAVYGGTLNFSGSTSPAVVLVVNQPAKPAVLSTFGAAEGIPPAGANLSSTRVTSASSPPAGQALAAPSSPGILPAITQGAADSFFAMSLRRKRSSNGMTAIDDGDATTA